MQMLCSRLHPSQKQARSGVRWSFSPRHARQSWLGWLLTFVLLSSAAVVQAAEPPAPPAAPKAPNYERQLDEARKRLDEAARKLAELHQQAARTKVKKHEKKGSRAMLGVIIDEPKRNGEVVIVGITPGSGAAAAGLRSGDKIVALDDQELRARKDDPHAMVGNIMRTVKAGDPVQVQFVRNGKRQTLEVITQSHREQSLRVRELKRGCDCDNNISIDLDIDDMGDFNWDKERLSKLIADVTQSLGHISIQSSTVMDLSDHGGKFVSLEPDLAAYFGVTEGVLVVSPPKTDLDIKAGDVILEVAGERVGKVSDVTQALKKRDEPTMVQLQRQGESRQLLLTSDLLSGVTTKVIRINTSDGEPEVRIVQD